MRIWFAMWHYKFISVLFTYRNNLHASPTAQYKHSQYIEAGLEEIHEKSNKANEWHRK